ncbi:MAG: DUF5615 family PIN-like protein [Bacteroidota bacterium]
MKILLDECVSRKVKNLLSEFEVYTVDEMGFNGLKNGKLLTQAEKNEFDIVLTIDKNIDSQQNIRKYAVSLVILNVLKSNIKYFGALIPEFKSQIHSFRKGYSYTIG